MLRQHTKRLLALALLFVVFVVLPTAAHSITQTKRDTATRITEHGDTLFIQKRDAAWRIGVFGAGEAGTDIGGVYLPIDLNNTSHQALYESSGLGASYGVNAGISGTMSILPQFSLSTSFGFMSRRGLFRQASGDVANNAALYDEFQAETRLHAVTANVMAEYQMDGGVQVYGGFLALFPTLLEARMRFGKPNIGDTPPATELSAHSIIPGIAAGARYYWHIRETAQMRTFLVPFVECAWQPSIGQSQALSGNASSWGAALMRLGMSFAIEPIITDTLEIRRASQKSEQQMPQETIARNALLPERSEETNRSRATKLPVAGMSDSLLAEQTFLYSAVALDNTDVLPSLQEFIQAILPEIGTNKRFRLALITLPEDKALAEKRLQQTIKYLEQQNISRDRIESSTIERQSLQAVQRLRLQIFR